MTLFDVDTPPLRRQSKPLGRGKGKPVWTRYTVKQPVRCDECLTIAYESLPGPLPGVFDARHSRRQDGVTRLLCQEHGQAQRDEDRAVYGLA